MTGLLPTWYWPLDGWIVVAGVLCAVNASLLGNFLVLRRMSLLGDAISHAVLPGLAIAFLLTGARSSWPMFIGAVVVGVLTAFFTQWIRNAGNVDEGASMGVVFTTLFALGLVLIVGSADHVDLDPGCVLYGAIEFTPLDTWTWGSWEIPRVVGTLGGVLVLNLVFVGLFFKELRISSFDPALATTLGISATALHYALMVLVAITAVASFESVGNILVVAMMVVPPAAALMMTDRLSTMVVWSAGLAAVGAVSGHWAAITVPSWWGFRSTSTAGMMAVMIGLLFVLAAVFGWRHGLWWSWLRQRRLVNQIVDEDLLACCYRREERDAAVGWSESELAEQIPATPRALRQALLRLARQGWLTRQGERWLLTPAGSQVAQGLVRSHRLWETYLAQEGAAESTRVHAQAEQLEHFTDRQLRGKLGQALAGQAQDPHGSPIPPEHTEE